MCSILAILETLLLLDPSLTGKEDDGREENRQMHFNVCSSSPSLSCMIGRSNYDPLFH